MFHSIEWIRELEIKNNGFVREEISQKIKNRLFSLMRFALSSAGFRFPDER